MIPPYGNNLEVQDVPVFGTDGTLANVAQVPTILGPIYGVGFTGFVAAGDLMVVANMEKRRSTEGFVARLLAGSAPDLAITELWRPEMNALNVYHNAIVLRPGEVVTFKEPIDGLTCLVVPAIQAGSFAGTAASDPVIPTRQGIARIYRAPTNIQNVAFTRVGFQLAEHVPATSIAGVSTALGTLSRIPQGTEKITVYIYDGTIPLVAQTPSLEVWWQNSYGQWMHNDADDLDAGGRGVASAAHSAEAYDVPMGAIAIAVLQPTTTETVTAAFFAW